MPWKKWTHLCHLKSLGGMGFQDLYTFNLTPLAKLVTEPHSLLKRILKVKYFPTKDVLPASTKASISFAYSGRIKIAPARYLTAGRHGTFHPCLAGSLATEAP